MCSKTSLLVAMLITLCTIQISVFPTVNENTHETQYDVIIVGGDWSGFTAAYYLKDYDIKVLEPNSSPGWSVWTEVYEMFPYEPETTGQEQSPLSRMIDVLGLKINKIPSPLQAYFHSNQFYFGLASSLIAQSSESEYNRFAALVQTAMQRYRDLPNFDTQLPAAELDNLSAEQWLKTNQFSQAYLDQFNVISRRYFGSNVSEVSALSLLVKISKDFMDDINAHVFTDAYATPKAISNYFGNIIQSDADVLEVTKSVSRYTVLYEDKDKQRHAETARIVILSVPPPDIVELAATLLTQEQTELLQSIPYRSEITLQIYSAPPIFDKAFNFTPPDNFVYTAVYDDLWFDRNSDPNYSTEMNSATFILSPQSNHDSDFMSMGNYDTDDEMVTKFYMPFLQGLSPILPTVQEIGPQGAMGFVTYYKSDIEPILTVGAYHRLQQLHNSIQNGLIPVGDYMIYPGFEGKVNSGYWAAQKAQEFLGQTSGGLSYDLYR